VTIRTSREILTRGIPCVLSKEKCEKKEEEGKGRGQEEE